MSSPVWHVTLRLTFFEIFAVKILDFGAPGGTPKWEALCPKPISTIMQNLTPIGVAVAETSVCNRTDTRILGIGLHTISVNDLSDKSHSSVA